MFSEKPAHQTEKGPLTEQRVLILGSLLHDEWRRSRWQEESQNFDPQIKKTTDETWSQAHRGATEVDIANTAYEDLPEDWKKENRESARVAVMEVERALGDKMPLDEHFIEEASSVLHDAWRERNQSWAPPEQNVPYFELSEEEKEKDRVIIKKAITICTEGQF